MSVHYYLKRPCSNKKLKAKRKEYQKEYNQRPEAKARKKEYRQTPEYKAKQKAYYQRPEVKARRKEYQKEYQKEYYQTPEAKARKKEYRQTPEYKAKQKAYYQRKKVKKKPKPKKPKTQKYINDICPICKKAEAISPHHIRPRKLGGSDFNYNIIWLCIDCHNKVEYATDKWIEKYGMFEISIMRNLILNKILWKPYLK